MEERKSMGTALVDVFDAGVTLVKAEVNGVARKVGEVAKAKGLGAVILLAAVGPLILGLIFLILALFYLLMLWLPAWGAALVIALLSLAVTAGLIMFGLKKLSAEVDTSEPLLHRDEIAWADQGSPSVTFGQSAAGTTTVSTTTYAAHTTPDAATTTTYAATTGTEVTDDIRVVDRSRTAHTHPTPGTPEVPGVPVSTEPTYRDDMRRGGNA